MRDLALQVMDLLTKMKKPEEVIKYLHNDGCTTKSLNFILALLNNNKYGFGVCLI